MEPFDASTTPGDPPAEPAAEREPGADAPDGGAGAEAPASSEAAEHERVNMLPRRERRRLGVERLLVRIIATCGIVGIGVALGAILVSQKVAGWIDGLVIAGVTVILAAILWSSRQL